MIMMIFSPSQFQVSTCSINSGPAARLAHSIFKFCGLEIIPLCSNTLGVFSIGILIFDSEIQIFLIQPFKFDETPVRRVCQV